MVAVRGRTQVAQGSYPLGDFEPLCVVNHGSFGLAIMIGVVLAFSQIAFQGDKYEVDVRAVFENLTDPFRFYVLERVWGVDLSIVSGDALECRSA